MNKGMTLIEIIIAVALLAILALVMLTVFGTTVTGIYDFGHDTQTVLVDKKNMEESISNSIGSTTVTLDTTDSNMDFVFENSAGDEINVTIIGNMMETNELDFEYFVKKE